MTPDPRVLRRIGDDMTQHVQNRVTVVDERVPGAALESAITEKRDQRGDEQHVERPQRHDTAHRLLGDIRLGVLE